MPGRDIKKEKEYVKRKENAIAKEIRFAREDFKDLSNQYKALKKEFDKLEKIHLKKVQNGKEESELERVRYESTKSDLEEFRKTLSQKEMALLAAQAQEADYNRSVYETLQRTRGMFMRFFAWMRSIPERIADSVLDVIAKNKDLRRMEKMTDEERQMEIRKMRAEYSLHIAEKTQERENVRVAKETILENPLNIRGYENLKSADEKDMAVALKLVELSGRECQTFYVGLGQNKMLKFEYVDFERSHNHEAYVSIKLCELQKDAEGKNQLNDSKEIGHIHMLEKNTGIRGTQWEIDLSSSEKTLLRSMVAAERVGEEPAIRNLTEKEKELIAQVTLSDIEKKRMQYNREYGIEPEQTGKQKDAEKEKASQDSNKNSPEEKRDVEKKEYSGKESVRSDEKGHAPDSSTKETGTEAQGKEKKRFSLFQKPEPIPTRAETEKKIEKAIKELHDGYRKDKTLKEHQGPVSVTVDRYTVSICPPNAKNDTAYYKIDDRYAGKYMKSGNNPAFTMDYIHRHGLLENPIKTLSTEGLTPLQLEGNIARGILHDINHHTDEVSGYMEKLQQDVRLNKVAQFMSSDIGKYQSHDAIETMQGMFQKIQTYEIDDSYKDSPIADVCRSVYRQYMGREEMTHAGAFSLAEVNYMDKDGTLYDKDGKLFAGRDGGVVTLDNCTEFCPKEEVNTIVSELQERRSMELGELNEKVEPEPGINAMDNRPIDEQNHEELEHGDWNHSYIEQEEEIPVSYSSEETETDISFNDAGIGVDFALQNNMDYDDMGYDDTEYLM